MVSGTSIYDQLLCAEHGWKSHVFIHEAAHVVAALDRNYEFSEVTINSPADWGTDTPGQWMLGGVQMVGSTTEWIMADVDAALEFTLAGSEAEKLVYGHNLEASHQGDLLVFASGFNPEGRTQEQLRAELPSMISAGQARAREWALDAYPRIRLVAVALAGQEASTTRALIDDHAGPWTLTKQQVQELLASES